MAFGIDDIIGAGLQIINKFVPDPQAQAAAAQEFRSQVLVAAAATDAAQAQTNTAEAGSRSLFVAGWRPAVGWICAVALGYQYLGRPLVAWALMFHGAPLPDLPGLDDNLWQLLFGMLGMGTLRTVEKIQEVSKGTAFI